MQKKWFSEGAKVIIHGLEEDFGMQFSCRIGFLEKAKITHRKTSSMKGLPQRFGDLAYKKAGEA